MKNNKVAVYVGGRRFILVSSESEEYVKNIAKRVNEKIGLVTKNYTQLDARGCAIMAALDFADDEQKALGKKAELVHQADKILKQADKQSKQIIELKKQNAELDKKYDELLEQFQDLKKKNSNLTAQYNELKKFLDKQVGLSSSAENAQKNSAEKNSAEKIEDGNNQNAQAAEKQKSAEKSSKPARSDNNRKKPAPKISGSKKSAEKTAPQQSEGKIDESIIKPESAADIMRKGYMPLRQYSLFDDENK